MRCVVLLFALSMLVSGVITAQPKRLWKRDGHSSSPRVLGLDVTRRYLYTESAGALYLWDTEADTVVRRLLVSGTNDVELNHEHVYLMDDTTVYAKYGDSLG